MCGDGLECGAWCKLGHVRRARSGAPGVLSHARYGGAVRFRTDNLRPPRGTKRLAGRFCARRLVAIPHTCGREPGGKRRCQSPSAAAPFHDLLRGTLTALASRGDGGRCARGGASPYLAGLREARMTVSSAAKVFRSLTPAATHVAELKRIVTDI